MRSLARHRNAAFVRELIPGGVPGRECRLSLSRPGPDAKPAGPAPVNPPPSTSIRPGNYSASTATWASSPGDACRRVGRVEVAGDSCQVQLHGLHRPGRIAGLQRGDQLVVIDLVFLPALP